MFYFLLTLSPILVASLIYLFFKEALYAFPAYPVSLTQTLIPLWLILINIWSTEVLGFGYWAFIFLFLSLALMIDLRRYWLKTSHFTIYHYFKHATYLIFLVLTVQLIAFTILGWLSWLSWRL